MADWIEEGAKAPDFTLPTHDGTKLKLSSLKGHPVVLYFYPKDDTPGCTKEACGFRDAKARLARHKAVVLGISPDTPDSHATFRKKYSLPFTLLADVDHTVSEAYGVWAEKSMYGRSYMGIVRSAFLIDENGVIEQAWYKVSPADTPTNLLKALGR